MLLLRFVLNLEQSFDQRIINIDCGRRVITPTGLATPYCGIDLGSANTHIGK
jgi:hypothetical protein